MRMASLISLPNNTKCKWASVLICSSIDVASVLIYAFICLAHHELGVSDVLVTGFNGMYSCIDGMELVYWMLEM